MDDLLRIRLGLSDEEESSHARLTSATDWAHTYKLFAQNPLWLGGRVRMAEALERLGKYEEASVLRYEIAFILESEQAYRDLLHTAVRGGVEAQREFAEENLKKILGFKKNKGLATAMIDSVLQKASLNNDSELSEMYIKKYQAWFPEIDSGEGCGPS